MQTHKYKYLEYTSVKFSELGEELRIDAQFFDALYLDNENLIKSKTHCKIDTLLEKKQYGLSLAMNEDNIGYKILKMDDIIGILASDEKAKFADIEETHFLNSKLEIGDILFNRVNSEEYVGRTGIYLMDGEHTFASYLVRLRAKEYYTNFYITMFLNSKQGKLCLDRVKRRAVNQANINAVELGNLYIPTPSPEFQQKIEELVEKSYEEKEKSESLYKEAENILLQELNLSGFQPSTKEFNLFHQLFPIENNSSIIKYSDLIDTDRLDADYWDNKYLEIENKIKRYAGGYDTILNLSELSKDKIQLEDDDLYNYIELADINKFTGLVENTTEILGKELPSRARMEIQKGDVLMSSLEGSIDKVAIIDFEKDNLVASTGFYIFREGFLNKETLLILLKFLGGRYIVREALGTIMSAISNSGLENILLPKVDKGIQDTIALKIQESFIAKEQSKKLLEVAKRGVEVYIEETEEKGLEYIESNI